MNDAGHFIHILEGLVAGFCFILELEAQPGLAMADIVDVVFSAGFFDNLAGELFVLFRHLVLQSFLFFHFASQDFGPCLLLSLLTPERYYFQITHKIAFKHHETEFYRK